MSDKLYRGGFVHTGDEGSFFLDSMQNWRLNGVIRPAARELWWFVNDDMIPIQGTCI